jgi:hypothetical protein
MTAPITSNTLGVNILTALGKAIVGERPRPFGEPLGVDPATSTSIFGQHDAGTGGRHDHGGWGRGTRGPDRAAITGT